MFRQHMGHFYSTVMDIIVEFSNWMVLVEQIDFIKLYHLMKITDGTKIICCI